MIEAVEEWGKLVSINVVSDRHKRSLNFSCCIGAVRDLDSIDRRPNKAVISIAE